MRKPASNAAALALAVVMTATGCYAHFDVGATRASYAAADSDAAFQDCTARVIRAQESFNAHGRWWSRSVVAGLVIGAVVSVVAIAAGRDTPGDHAMTTAAAVDAERSFSGLELTTAGLAGLAGADAVLAWYATSKMTADAAEVADQLTRCPPRPPAPASAPAQPPPKPAE